MNINFKPFINRLPEPLYTVFYFLLKLDLIALGIIAAILVQVVAEKWDVHYFVWTMVWVYLPFLSYIPYQMFKRHYQWISHYIGYQPIWYFAIGIPIVWFGANYWMADAAMYIWLFILASLIHFVRAARAASQGISLMPFTGYVSFAGDKLRLLSNDAHEKELKGKILKIQEQIGVLPWERTWRQELATRQSIVPVPWIIILIVLLIWLSLD